jgi:hypothetical protein
MRAWYSKFLLAAAMSLPCAALTLGGCEVDVKEGPAEEAGEDIDDALDNDDDKDVDIDIDK